MGYQYFGLAVPVFFVLSGRVMVDGILRTESLEYLSTAFIKRPFRLVFPLVIVNILTFLLHQLGVFVPFQEFTDRDIRVPPVTPSDSLSRIFHDCLVFIIGSRPTPLASYVTWTLPIEYSASNYIYSLAFIIIMRKSHNFTIPFLLILFAINFYFMDWNAYFIFGLLVAVLSQNYVFVQFSNSRWSIPVKLAICLFFCRYAIQSEYTYGNLTVINNKVHGLQIQQINIKWMVTETTE